MRLRSLAIAAVLVSALVWVAPQAAADSAQPGQSMTHMKTAPGLAAALEGAGVVLYSQGGATSAVMGESIAAEDGQVVFHIPITSTKKGLKHAGSTLVFFHTGNERQVQLRNPVIDLTKGVISASIPQAGGKPLPVLTITNAKTLKPSVATDDTTGIRTTTYAGAKLALAPGVAATLASLLELPESALADKASFGTADVSLKG